MKYKSDLEKAISLKKNNKKLLEKVRKQKSSQIDAAFMEAHEETFKEIDCLKCANCCKTTSPIFIISDIKRLSRHFRISSKSFIDTYLVLDMENDYVLKSSPCPFLQPDNTCEVYESRPKACREYPHTNRKKMYQITDLTLRNSLICPAVVRILDKIREIT